MSNERYIPLIDLELIRRGLVGLDTDKAIAHLDELIEYKPGDLVEYQSKDGMWVDGVVVAWMVHQPSYICGKGDDRENVPDDLLACSSEYVRPRREVVAKIGPAGGTERG